MPMMDHSGIFFYDFASNHFFYTSPSFVLSRISTTLA